MRFETDARGGVIPSTIQLTSREIRRWLYKPTRNIPPHLREAIQRERDRRDKATAEAELDARFPDRHIRANDPRARRPWVAEVMLARVNKDLSA